MADVPQMPENIEAEVWTAISAFEQILEAMPQDRASLEALSHAYEQIGDITRQQDYLLRLGSVLVDQRDSEAIARLREKIEPLCGEDDRFAKLAERMSEVVGAAAPEVEEGDEPEVHDTELSEQSAILSAGIDISDEMSFAWDLVGNERITQEEYASIVQDLTEMTATDTMATVSVLHVLESRGFKSLERIMASVSMECGCPLVSLDSFDFAPEAISMFPLDFMARRGIVVFGFMGDEPLAVVMNPYGQKLREDVARLTGKEFHYFMAMPSGFDRALERITEQVTEVALEEE